MRKLFVVTALIASSHLQAQTVQDRKDTLENVTLTASKFSIKTTETGKVVVTINRQQLEKAGSRDLSQVITELGGVFINGYTNNAGKDKSIYLRGGKVDYTLITVDGIPVYDASGIGSNFDIRYLPVDIVERIEIVKGSQSTLYGSDAIAGVINIITRKGGTKPFSGSSVLNYGSYNTWRANTSFNGAVKAFDYNLALSHHSTDGFSEAQRPAVVSRAFDNDWYRQNSVQANFGVQAAKNFRIQPFLRYSANSGALDNDAFVDELDFDYRAKNLQTGVKNTIGLGTSQLNVLYQLNKTKRDYLDDSTLSRNGFYKFSQTAYEAIEHFAEAFVVYPFRSFRLTAGSDFRSSHTDYTAYQVSAFGASKTAQSGDSVKQHQTSLYAALNYSQNGFSIEGGGRFNQHSVYGSNFAFNFNPSYLIGSSVKVFANASSGYKTPSLYQLFSVYGNRDLAPETSLNLEGGAQIFLPNNRGAVRATYFNRNVKDVIAFFYNPATFRSGYINQDKQHDQGIEVDGNITLTEKLQLRAFYSYVDGKVTTRQAGKDTTYFNLLRRPKHSATLFLGSQLTKAFYVSVNMNFVGERNDIYFNPVTFASNPVSLKPYTLVNLYAEHGFLQNRLKLFADVRNLLDKTYSDIYGYNTAGLNAYGGFRFRF
ncbi:MAG: TonB-dependent receptor [Bacteroidota bacterium]|nr:TonB-dependent receptor [Bacteroidota bacterium]